jgi:O-antigen/teichoic acid export membrane protein
MTEPDPSHFLRVSLRGNALFSTISGLTFAVANSAIAKFLGDLPAMLVASTGAQLLLFAGVLVWLASREQISKPLVIAVIVADLLWVVGTVVVVYLDALTRGGAIAAVIVADVVLLLAVLQSIGLRRWTPSDRPPRITGARQGTPVS